MNNDAAVEIAGLPVEELGTIAGEVLGERAVASGAPEVKKIGRSVGSATAGIYRVAGEARTASRERRWSAVVKALGRPEHRDAGEEAEALHEAEVYRSRAFAEVCGGVRAPRCYAILKRGPFVLLWLEDLSNAPQPPWEPEHFIATARNIGRFNAHWPEENLPTWEWLLPGGMRATFHSAHNQKMFERLPSQNDNPLVSRFAPPDAVSDLLQLWDESDTLVALADAAPKGICHRDCHPKNLFPMHDADGNSYTVGLDWVKVGADALGLDIGHLLASPTAWLEMKPEETRALVDPVFDAYVAGLREEGWSGNEDRVRITFLTRLGYEAIRNTRLITMAAVDVAWRTMMETFLYHTIEEIVDRYAAARPFYLECKDEALRLAKRL